MFSVNEEVTEGLKEFIYPKGNVRLLLTNVTITEESEKLNL